MEIHKLINSSLKFGSVLLLSLSLANAAHSTAYIRLHYGYYGSQHAFVEDEATQQSIMQSIDINLLTWRRKRVGYLSRGPRLQWIQAEQLTQVSATLPIYQWTPDHGAYFEYRYSQWQLDTNWSTSRLYLQDNGTAVSTGIGESRIESEQTQWQLYWLEGVNQEGPINRVGLSYLQQNTPASAEISGVTADLYDADFTGWGIQLGRIKHDRGLNFQWLLDIYNLQTDFSNSVTQHRATARGESEDLRLNLQLDWHYRYRIEPYWYWVPKVGSQLTYQTQSDTNPQIVKHDAFTSVDWYASLGLEITF
ncbi:hypothetical protein HF888_10365 [Bermanella marisrubri]|uniref:Uncharacterized protein n=1 Tax=Bermanella marisrubri TaxID=207949 RepID=Q1N5W1_9GAMM|nr:hypothetical protein [Bermanella marisrubri]EAT13831.1 hypothetical protein RED65_10574 [Oceanobacter sp. RED65] [Bermanella marisrubri]QIZ84594.1 hypothetical protein HF888_10365 [Bermanella marisrubri]